ncbi:hypothetical protein MLD38_027153 [Melastoma candidum]|uniref:Uncharacterized protein n=1 Tax=Melastoma candidum TaxID=119954 RepID=A0ACB9P458_9MYRT|nr:hypothetical protein MLD38_027153 [Melastoma candidum]
MEPFVENNGEALLGEASGLDNAGGVRAEEECDGEIAAGVEGEVEETLGCFCVSVDGETAYHNGEGEGKVAGNKVQIREGDLGLGSLETREGTGVDGDSFMNEMGNGNDAAASGSLEVPLGAVEEGYLHDETGEPLGDEGHVTRDRGIKVAYEQSVGKDGEIDKIEVSGDGISLYVEFSGPATQSSGFRVSLKDKHEDMEVAEKNEECSPFDVGDVVWVKTKSQSWWPGKILDPSGAEVDISKAAPGHLPVAYLGSSHVLWCLPSELKVFHENYWDMLKQNKSRFTGAVDKAAHEFGKRVMEKLTSKREKDMTSLLDEVGEYSSTLLEPQEFLLKLKSLAVNLMRPGMLDFTVMMNYMMAFYRSIGHENKPMHLLLLETDLENDADEIPRKRSIGFRNLSGRKKFDSMEIGSGVVEASDAINLPSSALDGDGEGLINGNSDMGPESRSRKKSKYLSYPYVNYGNREPAYMTEEKISSQGPDEAAIVGISMDGFTGSPSIVNLTRKKILRTRPKKLLSSPDILTFRSDEFLAEIGSLALDCVYSDKSDKVHRIEWFSNKLRSYLFHDQHIYETYVKNLSHQKEDDSADTSSPTISTELKERSRRGKRIPDTEDENNKMKPLSGLSDVSDGFDAHGSLREGLPDLNNGTVLGSSTSAQPKRRKRTVGIGERTTNATEAAFDHEDHMSNDSIKQGVGETEATPNCNGSRNKNRKLKSSVAVPQAADHRSLSLPDLNRHQVTILPSTSEHKQRQQKRRKEVARSNNQGNGNANPMQDVPPPFGSTVHTADAAPQLDYIKQNLQTVTNMLGSSRGNLAPEMKAQLEGEIKNLLDKVSGM